MHYLDQWENAEIARVVWALKRRARWPLARIRRFQLQRLRSILKNASLRFEVYRDRMDDAGIIPARIRNVAELSAIGPITKGDYREMIEVAEGRGEFDTGTYHRGRTSGSTGKPLTILRTRKERAYLKSKLLWLLLNNGFKLSDVLFWPVSPERVVSRDSIIQRLGILRRVSPSYLTAPEDLCRSYEEVKPAALMSNRSILALMAAQFEKEGARPHQPRLCICSGESSDPMADALLGRVFGAGQFDFYGAAECGVMAFRRPGEKYHRVLPTCILEVERDSQGELNAGKVVVTDLHIESFPVIRYELGDIATLGHEDGWPVIRELKGRDEDLLFMPDGSKKGWYHFKPALSTPNAGIMQYRVVQQERNLTKVQVVLRPGIDASGTIETIHRRLREGLGPAMNWLIEVVDVLPPDRNGKLRTVTSLVEPE